MTGPNESIGGERDGGAPTRSTNPDDASAGTSHADCLHTGTEPDGGTQRAMTDGPEERSASERDTISGGEMGLE